MLKINHAADTPANAESASRIYFEYLPSSGQIVAGVLIWNDLRTLIIKYFWGGGR